MRGNGGGGPANASEGAQARVTGSRANRNEHEAAFTNPPGADSGAGRLPEGDVLRTVRRGVAEAAGSAAAAMR